MSKEVKTGDKENLESRASVYYWKNLFSKELGFTRDRFGDPPNNLLNYGYAILRAIVARGLVSSGLLPTLGIFHKNKYNAYCLADDIMEPYRPYVDNIVCEIVNEGYDSFGISTDIKKRLLELSSVDIEIDGQRSPLSIGMQRTTSSLAKCYEGIINNIIFPEFA
jgi:CRISPR-associated protein Cas1